jgi:hypothetical protein
MNTEALGRFAANARLTPEEREDTDAVVRLYILAHISTDGADPVAHSLIGNDFHATRLRMRAPPLTAYKTGVAEIDPGTFLHYVEHAYHEPEGESNRPREFLKFEHAFFPRPVGEEHYRYVTRPGKWRECAAYLALGMRAAPVFGTIARSLELEPRRLAGYLILDPERYAAEVGRLLADMKLPEAERVWITPPPVAETPPPPKVEQQDLLRLCTIAGEEDKASGMLEELRSEMAAFRARALLGVNFDLEKLAKQMVLSAAGVTCAPRALLGDYQTETLPALVPGESATALRALDALRVPPAASKHLTSSTLAHTVAQSCAQPVWQPRVLLRTVVEPRAHMSVGQYERYMTNAVIADEDSAFVAAIVALGE